MKRAAGVAARMVIAAGACVVLSQAATSDYAGAAACGACHPDKFARQSASEHAHALARPLDHTLAQAFVAGRTIVRSGKYQFQFFRDGQGLSVRAFDQSRQIEAPIEWAFGAGSQAVTFVSRVNAEWYLEHSLSYYPAAGSYAATPGQSEPAEDTLAASIGKLFRSDAEMRNCFQCHSTGPVSRSESGTLQPLEKGVRCEACHGAGRTHIEAAKEGDRTRARTSIQNPARLDAKQLLLLCGTCHRQPAGPGAETDWRVPWNVRHQPIYLNQAACYRKSAGALSCMTCHDPHGKLGTDQASYNSKCTGCHPSVQHSAAGVPVSETKSDCVGCHMPKVSPQSWLRFTNHWIGIYTSADKLKPVVRP